MTEISTCERLGDVMVVTLRGEIDAYSAPLLRSEFHSLLEDKRVMALVVDLECVTFLDSSVLGALVGALRRMRERGGHLQIVRPSGSADRIFALTSLDTVFNLHSTRGAALSAARG